MYQTQTQCNKRELPHISGIVFITYLPYYMQKPLPRQLTLHGEASRDFLVLIDCSKIIQNVSECCLEEERFYDKVIEVHRGMCHNIPKIVGYHCA